MPLSRLSPRSRHTGIAPTRQARQTGKNSSRHLRLWEAIRQTRDEIDRWQQQVNQVDNLFQRYIVPREEQLTDAYCTVTELLMQYFEQSQLSIADQSLLGLWITENLQALSDHPFAPIQRRQHLNNNWRTIISIDGPIENQLARLAQGSNFVSGMQDRQRMQPETAEQCTNDSMTHDQDHARHTAAASQAQEQAQSRRRNRGNCTDTQTRTHQTNNRNKTDRPPEQNNQGSDSVDILEQRLSIERLFRQLAKVLHPDREQDESVKAQKHILMSQCLKARADKDINTLLSLYCTHVGELPDDLSDTSHEELIVALQQQLKRLQWKLRRLRFGDPLHTQIVERYSAISDADCERRILSHADSLDVEIANTHQMASILGTHEGLEQALLQRREVELDKLAIDELTGS